MKMGLLCCLNWILIFRISFHLLKTQLQKCFIKPCFKKDHVWFVFKNTIFPELYTPYKKIKNLYSLEIIPLLVQHWHPSSVYSLPWVHSLLFLHSFVKVLPFTRGALCILWSHTANFLFLCALQSWGIWWLLCWPCSTHRNDSGSWRISYRPQTSYHNPARLSPKLQSGLVAL